MEKVSKKAIRYWRLQALFGIVNSAIVIAICATLYYFFPVIKIPLIFVGAVAILYFLYEVIYRMWLHPVLFYKYYEFKITDDELIVNSGVFNRKHIIIPLFRIQNVDVTEGPIMKRFGLKGMTISTAGGGTYIPELEKTRADELRTIIRDIVRTKQVNKDD